MDPELLIAYRAGIAKGYPPRDLVLLAVHFDAPNAAHYCPWLPASRPRLPWCYGARTKAEAFALLGDADRARATEAYAHVRLEDVFVIHVVEDGQLRFAPERRPQR
jgi:hypothetical protein